MKKTRRGLKTSGSYWNGIYVGATSPHGVDAHARNIAMGRGESSMGTTAPDGAKSTDSRSYGAAFNGRTNYRHKPGSIRVAVPGK